MASLQPNDAGVSDSHFTDSSSNDHHSDEEKHSEASNDHDTE